MTVTVTLLRSIPEISTNYYKAHDNDDMHSCPTRFWSLRIDLLYLLFSFHLKNERTLAICGATFAAEDFKLWKLTPPIVLSLVREICSSSWCYKYLTPSSCSTNSQTIYSIPADKKSFPASNMHLNFLKDIAIFFPPIREHSEPTFERISTTQPSLTFRVLTTAYLLDSLSLGFISTFLVQIWKSMRIPVHASTVTGISVRSE
jgi:hypothetical protein